MRKDLRKGKVFVDWSQNDRHKTTVCAIRCGRGAADGFDAGGVGGTGAAAEERGRGGLVFETGDVIKRVKKKGDLFEPVLKMKQKLPRIG